MIGAFLAVAALASLIFFPWLFTVLLALAAAAVEPLVPLGIGILADALYYSSHAYAWPVYSILGALVSATALFVRTRLRTGMMR